ncbi:MAG: hypothetical protein ACM3PT_11295 [Deltaproteobacteria bacterium]
MSCVRYFQLLMIYFAKLYPGHNSDNRKNTLFIKENDLAKNRKNTLFSSGKILSKNRKNPYVFLKY